MPRPTRVIAAAAAIVWMAAVLSAGRPAGQATAAARVDYRTHIQPLIAERCLECHNQDRRQGGLSLATYEDMLEGGRTGAVIRPGGGARSLLIHRVTGAVEPQMPKDERPLAAGEIALIQRWIDQGARRTPTAPAAPQPWEPALTLTKPVVPGVVWARWNAPLDRFVASYLVKRRAARPAAVPDAARGGRSAPRTPRGAPFPGAVVPS